MTHRKNDAVHNTSNRLKQRVLRSSVGAGKCYLTAVGRGRATYETHEKLQIWGDHAVPRHDPVTSWHGVGGLRPNLEIGLKSEKQTNSADKNCR